MYTNVSYFLQIHEQNQRSFVNIQKTLYFQNHLQQKVLDGFQWFFIPCKAEIVSSHEHLESFNSTDSSLRYRSKHCACNHYDMFLSHQKKTKCPTMIPDHPSIIIPDRTGLYWPLEQSYRFCDICNESSTWRDLSRSRGPCGKSCARAPPLTCSENFEVWLKKP